MPVIGFKNQLKLGAVMLPPSVANTFAALMFPLT